MELENQIAPGASAPLPTELVVPSVITKEHDYIGRDFLDRAAHMLRQDGTKIRSYSVEEAASEYYPDTEKLTLEVDSKTTLTLTLYKRRK